MRMDRREFVRLSLQAVLAAGAYPVLSHAEARALSPGEDGAERHITGCMWCQNGCSLIVYVKDGKAVHVTGNPADPVTRGRMCVKPLGSLELLQSPLRLSHPLKRVGPRGDGAGFQRISWDQALDEIAAKLRSLRERHGGRALGIWASGRSASDGRKLNAAFARLYGTPNYEKTGPFCNYSAKPAGVSVVGTRHTPWTYTDDDFFAADLYVFVGSNMAATRPVIHSRLRERRAQGKCRLVVVDPRRSETAGHADTWLPIRPGTDLALALTLIHYLISRDSVDHAFIRSHTVGYERLRAEILARGYTLAWGAGVTGLGEGQIQDLAEVYAQTRKAIVIGNAGLSHHTNAVQTHRAFYLLAAITGHFGEKAMGYGCLNNGGRSTGRIPLPEEKLPPPEMELSKNPVGWLESIEDPAYPYALRGLIATGSPLTQWPDQSRLRRLMDRLEISVYNGLTKNVNAYYFDYILPAATWIEAGGLAPVSDDSRFVWVPQIVRAPGECRPDRWWWVELGQRMGWGEVFTDDLKDPVKLQDLAGAAGGYTVERFTARPDHALRAPIRVDGNAVEERGTLFLDKRFPTKSGKIELWTEELEERFAAYGLSAVPHYYTDPDAAPAGEPTIAYDHPALVPSPFQKGRTYTRRVRLTRKREEPDGYPLYLATGRPCRAIMGHTSHWIRRLNDLAPDQICVIHEDTAARLGIRDGDRVRVRSPFGEADARAVVSPGIRRDTVFVPYSYGEKSPFTAWRSINHVTNLEARCPVSGQVAFRGVRVEVTKA